MKKFKVVAVIVALLAAVAIANYAFRMDPVQLAARGVGRGAHDHDDAGHEVEEAPPPAIAAIGEASAPVVIEVFFAQDGAYRELFEPLMARIAQTYEPHVRVEPRSLQDEENNARCRELALRGQPGLAVNGEVIHEVASAGSFGMVVLTGSPEDRKWNELLLRKVIEKELNGKGIEFTRHAPTAPAVAPPEHQHTSSCGHNH